MLPTSCSTMKRTSGPFVSLPIFPVPEDHLPGAGTSLSVRDRYYRIKKKITVIVSAFSIFIGICRGVTGYTPCLPEKEVHVIIIIRM